MQYCADVKDNMLALLNNTGDSTVNIELINMILKHTYGLWADLHYCYKAGEITERCIEAIDEMLKVCHHRARPKLYRIRAECRRIGDEYRKLQNEYMYGSVSDAILEHDLAQSE